jgi:hypothetical protein
MSRQNTGGLASRLFHIDRQIAKQYKHLSVSRRDRNDRTRCSGAQPCSNTSLVRKPNRGYKTTRIVVEGLPDFY